MASGVTGPEARSSIGGPVYDAQIDSASGNADHFALSWERMQQAVDLHLFDSKTASAEAYSHVFESQPNRTAVELMGLASQRDLIQQAVDRVWDQPYPGVPLGAEPSFSRAPDTNPVLGPAAHFLHHAHAFESKRETRRRFMAA